MTDITPDSVQAMILRGPFHQWLGLKVNAVSEEGIELEATWREEWVANPDRGWTHGGIIATLLDLAADWSLVATTGRGVPTLDMRVDYHAPAVKGDLIVRGKVVKAGKTFSVAEAQVLDKSGKLLASSRGTYFTAPPKA